MNSRDENEDWLAQDIQNVSLGIARAIRDAGHSGTDLIRWFVKGGNFS